MPTSGDANYEGLDKTSQLIAQATVNGHQAMVEVDNREESDYRLNTQWFLYEDEQEWVKEETGTLSKEEAVKQADEIKNQLGMENWQYAEYKTSEAESIQNIMVTYTPSYENITAFQGPLIDLKSEDLYAANYYYSSLSIGFENGVLTSVELISPMDVVQIENQNVETMDFEEIYQIFKNRHRRSLQNQHFWIRMQRKPERFRSKYLKSQKDFSESKKKQYGRFSDGSCMVVFRNTSCRW